MKAKAESIEESDPNSAKTPLLSNPPSLRDLVEEEAQAHD